MSDLSSVESGPSIDSKHVPTSKSKSSGNVVGDFLSRGEDFIKSFVDEFSKKIKPEQDSATAADTSSKKSAKPKQTGGKPKADW